MEVIEIVDHNDQTRFVLCPSVVEVGDVAETVVQRVEVSSVEVRNCSAVENDWCSALSSVHDPASSRTIR